MSFSIDLAEIAAMTGGRLIGTAGGAISSVSPPEKGSAGSISPLWEKKYLAKLAPDAVLLTKPGWTPEGFAGVEVDDPRVALVLILELFERAKPIAAPEIHSTAVISEGALLGEEVSIGPGCVVGNASIGDKVILMGNVYIGDGVKIGERTLIEHGAVIMSGVSLGAGCIIHPNAVIGADGFGFVPDPDKKLRRIPQIGTVRIEDDVEIGSFTSVDRATFGETVIERGTKIDSHVKIGHNCHIGKYCIVVAQSGIAGSSTIGDGVTLASQSGVANHAVVGDGTTVAGRGGVTADLPPGSMVSGFPARDHKDELRERAAVRRLPDLIKDVKELRGKVEKLEKQL